MPHSLRAKIKGLRYKGIITDKDCDRLCKALDVLMAQADGEYKSNKELLCDSCYRKIAGCQAKFHNPHPVDHCIEYKPIEKQEGAIRNERNSI